mmetsp:Transcript_34101/g.97531  ORF Transcript_34101/g.97531 Transcript_34101/m.97531 type:complete len:230 (+) Transcript_34101:4256-4945(+)
MFSSSSLSELSVDIMVGTLTMPIASSAICRAPSASAPTEPRPPRGGTARGVRLGDAGLLAQSSGLPLLPITSGAGVFDPQLAEGIRAWSSGASMSKLCSPSPSLSGLLFGSSLSTVSSVAVMRNGLHVLVGDVGSSNRDVAWESVLSLMVKGTCEPRALSWLLLAPSAMVEPLPRDIVVDVRDLAKLFTVPSRLIFLTLSLSLVKCSFSLVFVCSTMLMMSARLTVVCL